MVGNSKLRLGALAAVLAAAVAAPASSTTLIRQSLGDLVGSHGKIVVGEVRDARSYWNKDETLILTDFRFVATEVLKGEPDEQDLTVTLLGGTVGEETHLLVGVAELVPGRSYVLFLRLADLPGGARAWTVSDHVQGAFDLTQARGELLAVSQASRHPLVPDRLGKAEPPGGPEGLPLDALVSSVREIAARQEVKR